VFSPTSETFIYDQIKGLGKIGIENHVLTQKRINEDKRPLSNVNLVKEKIHFFDKVLYKLSHNKETQLFNAGRFSKAIQEIKPDLIHAHFGPNGASMHNLILKKSLNIPLVTSLHGTDILLIPNQDEFYRLTLKEMSYMSRRLFTVNSNFLKQKAINCGINENVIYKLDNCFNSSFASYRKRTFYKEGQELRFITIGRLVKWKGHEYLIRGFAKFIKEERIQAKLTIIGEGDERIALERLVQQLNIENHVSFLGMVDHLELPSILGNHDVYVQPSIKDQVTQQEETFGIAILEAAAVGLPVIVTATGGIPEVVGKHDNQNCFIVPPKDKEAFCNTFKYIAGKEYFFRDNKSYFDKLNHKFSIKTHLNRLINIYQHLY